MSSSKSVIQRRDADLADAKRQENLVHASIVAYLVRYNYKSEAQTAPKTGVMQNIATRETLLDKDEEPPTTLKKTPKDAT
jgi:hypothetical protein